MGEENIFNAAMIMTKVGDEIEAMVEKLFKLISNRLEKINEIRKVELKDDDWDDSNEWVYTKCIRNRKPARHDR